METWLFGYGSIIWRPDFDFEHAQPGVLLGWKRRFWQGSPDHRGTPDIPGRVVTLLPDALERCSGRLFRLPPSSVASTLNRLDIREQGGYHRKTLMVLGEDGVRVEAICYVADPSNPNFLGSAPKSEVIDRIRIARGPSGSNREYVLRLAAALEDLGLADPYVGEIAKAL